MAPEAFLFANGRLVDVEGRTGEDRVVVAFFAEGRPKANIDFVGLAEGGGGIGVVAEGVAGFDALDERAEDFVEMRDVRNVEDFAAGLIDDFADIYEARCHGRGHARFRRIVAGDSQIVDHCVGSDGFGDDVARALAAGTGADVVTDKNYDPAVFLRSFEEILRRRWRR